MLGWTCRGVLGGDPSARTITEAEFVAAFWKMKQDSFNGNVGDGLLCLAVLWQSRYAHRSAFGWGVILVMQF